MEHAHRGRGLRLRYVLYPMLLICLLLGGCAGDDESAENMQTPTAQTPVAGTKDHCALCIRDSECAGGYTCNAFVDDLGTAFRCSTRAEEPACRLLSP